MLIQFFKGKLQLSRTQAAPFHLLNIWIVCYIVDVTSPLKQDFWPIKRMIAFSSGGHSVDWFY